MTRQFLIFFPTVVACFLLAGCVEDDGPGVQLNGDESAGPAPDIQATEPLSRKLEEFTLQHSKLVWVKYVGGKGDVFANGTQLELWGLDTRDGKGPRKIIEQKGNYGRPMISPDGKTIVFTNKNQTKVKKDGKDWKYFDPVTYRVDWEGKQIEKLGPGMASDVWEDINTGISWVYVTDLLPTDRAAMKGTKLERFKLYDPDDREVVWDKTEISIDNIQLSRDGKRASALFPWPDAGVIDLDRTEYWKNQHGCWPSLAPDDSYVAWVFDGAHKNLFFYTDRAKKTWTVPITGGPNIGNNEVYHPRWSNHVRYFSMTGPYIGETIGRGVGNVNLYLGKFDERLESVEQWLQLTDDDQDDYFPDLWLAKTGKSIAVEQGKDDGGHKKLWPRGGTSRLLFIWENRHIRSPNQAANDRNCSVIPHDRARYGPNFEMLVDGGWFEADNESREIMNRHGAKQARTTIELVATADDSKQDGAVFSQGNFQIQQRGDEWIFVSTDPKLIALRLGKVSAGKPTHLAVSFEKTKGWYGFNNGNPVPVEGEPPVADMLAAQAGMTFGSNWNGKIEGVAIYASALTPEEIEGNYDYFSKTMAKREPIPRIKLRGKLVKMTPDRSPAELKQYERALLGYHYEVEEVLEGEFDGETVNVLHFTLMDRKALESFPRRPGQSYELVIEPFEAHPELASEQRWDEIFEFGEDLYYDVATPEK
ncbi:MAG: hypothetical protein HKN23_07365 [Verrucomicrobiales bacterium]|nr:hypothetical protein [Verrucomicrobiales bacterium]